MSSMSVTVATFARVGASEILKCHYDGFEGEFKRRWMSQFGTTPTVCLMLWIKIDPHTTFVDEEGTNNGKDARPRHLLWALMWLKVYCTLEQMRTSLGNPPPVEKTINKWVRIFVRAISFLESSVILWNARYLSDIGNEALVTIDGTDMNCEIRFDKRFYSHKFKSGGLRYEVGVCIRTGRIVWIHGPFRCGKTDITISRNAVLYALRDGERVEADLGYRGEDLKINTPNEFGPREMEKMKQYARSRHETANQRMKIFGVLSQRYRHDIQYHSRCFRAVAVIVELNIETFAPLHDVVYVDTQA